MATPAQTRANQNNSQLSTGPVTQEGKAKVAANPLRHGLTSKHLLIPGEKQEDFDSLLNHIRSIYRPATPAEENLITEVAEHNWRLLRARRVETATLNLYVERLLPEAAGDPDRALALAFERHGRELERLRRYETTIYRAYGQAKKELELFVNTRIQAEARRAAEQRQTAQPAAQNQIGSVSQQSPYSSELPGYKLDSHGNRRSDPNKL